MKTNKEMGRRLIMSEFKYALVLRELDGQGVLRSDADMKVMEPEEGVSPCEDTILPLSDTISQAKVMHLRQAWREIAEKYRAVSPVQSDFQGTDGTFLLFAFEGRRLLWKYLNDEIRNLACDAISHFTLASWDHSSYSTSSVRRKLWSWGTLTYPAEKYHLLYASGESETVLEATFYTIIAYSPGRRPWVWSVEGVTRLID